MFFPAIENKLEDLYRRAPQVDLGKRHRLVILSDLHMGNGGIRDDFRANAPLVLAILEKYYLEREYTLVLNGDIEERQRFSAAAVRRAWPRHFDMLRQFRAHDRLYVLPGNHDWQAPTDAGERACWHPTLRLAVAGRELFLFHGHQASYLPESFIQLSRIVLRFIARPLGIRNYSVAHHSRRKYRVERRVYRFAKREGLIAMIGHTHRPLFESLSKQDSLKFEIERLCREYVQIPVLQEQIGRRLGELNRELQLLTGRDGRRLLPGSVYDTGPLVPCMFNSGCAIGKSGVTALEVVDGLVSLVHWYDVARPQKHLLANGFQPRPLDGNGKFQRLVLKEDSLDYIFTRIQLLA